MIRRFFRLGGMDSPPFRLTNPTRLIHCFQWSVKAKIMIVSDSKTFTESTPTNYFELSKFCVFLSVIGKEVIDGFSGDRQVREKSPRDFVTAVDEAVQKKVWEKILSVFPSSKLLGEESGSEPDERKIVSSDQLKIEGLFSEGLGSGSVPEKGDGQIGQQSELIWVIDPIDGTANFVHEIPYYAVSIAAVHNNNIVAGAVLDVCHDRCYWASCDSPAMLNEQEIKTSQCKDLSYAMLAISLPCDPSSREIAFRTVQGISEKCANIRRLGSAALNICNVAAGSLDGYWAGMLNLWDIAAAALILKRAGGSQEIQEIDGDWKLAYRCANGKQLESEIADCVAGVA